jgi:hypothetical protein
MNVTTDNTPGLDSIDVRIHSGKEECQVAVTQVGSDVWVEVILEDGTEERFVLGEKGSTLKA